MIATTIDPARPTKNNASRKSTRKCSMMITSRYFNGNPQLR
jgi:tRNA nucleotidyltransferase (CCA-adding enzyme)